MNVIAFFNNKGGVGKTTLTYHLAAMFADLGIRVLAVDLDPQANLTAMCLEDEQMEYLWPDGPHPKTLLGAVQPIIEGTGDVALVDALRVTIDDRLGLLAGDLGLSSFEDELSLAWPRVVDKRVDSLRSTTSFWRAIEYAAGWWKADVVLIDVGPNLGALNRAALICADQIIVPLAPDLFSLQGLRNLGPTLRDWRSQWRDRRERNASAPLSMPRGEMAAMGYVVSQHAMRSDRPVLAYGRWLEQIPSAYRRYVLAEECDYDQAEDPNRLAMLRNYRSLAPLAMEAHKPMFALKSADGALGAQQEAVQACYRDFRALAQRIADVAGVLLPMARARPT